MSSHSWADLPCSLSSAIPKARDLAQQDGPLKAFITSDAIVESTTFGIMAAGSKSAVTVTVSNGKTDIGNGNPDDCQFVLSALPEQWEEFFKQTPVAPYQR